MNSLKVDFVICCDMDDSKIVHCCDIGIDLLADSPAREYDNVEIVDTLDRSDVLTATVQNPPNTQNERSGNGKKINRKVKCWTKICMKWRQFPYF